jgi:peroxiredoxin
MEIYNNNKVIDGYRPQVGAFNLPSEPWVFIIDKRGRIAARMEGAYSVEELQNAMKAALKRS